MAVSLTIHSAIQIDVPYGRGQKQTDQNHTDFVIMDDVDTAGIVQRSNNFTASPLLLRIQKDGTYMQVGLLPFALSVLAVHLDLDNLRLYIKDGQTFVETRIGLTPTSTAEYVFGNSDDEMYLEIDFTNNTITAYA